MIPITIPQKRSMEADHQRAIMGYLRKSKPHELVAINTWLKKNGIAKQLYEEVLIASPAELAIIAMQIDRLPKKIPKSILGLKKLYSYFSTDRNTPFQLLAKKYSGYTFVDRTGVTVCPYCNRNFVVNVPGEFRRTSDLDHAFSQDRYPLLALSLYNLVPTCKVCNQIKSNKPGKYYNPYDRSIKRFPRFKINLLKSGYLDDASALEIKLDCPPAFKANNEHLFIEKIYSKHKDLVQDIVRKKQVYTNSHIKQIVKQLAKLSHPGGTMIADEKGFLDLLLGVFIQEADFHRRPFSKLTSDIWKQISQDKQF